MTHIVGFEQIKFLKRLSILILVVGYSEGTCAQVYVPIFKSIEMQATISPLGEMVEGDFLGRPCIAAVSESQKAIYFFEPDSLENLVLTNVVSLPDTPVAISKGKEVLIQAKGRRRNLANLAVLMKPDYVALISFGPNGQPEMSALSRVDQYSTGVRAVDMEADGKLDLVAYGKFSLGVSVEKNDGNGKFSAVGSFPGPLGNVPFSDIAFTDFNGDLVPDMAALDWVNRRLLIFYGRGDGTFAKPVSFHLKAEPSTLSVADLNGNGYPDIVVGFARLPEIDIFGGDGFGRFFLRQQIKTPAPVSKFAIADFTGDGTMDIAALSRTAGDIMMYAYDPLSRRFEYSGSVGTGESYENIVPFYFANRIKADLVASSFRRKYIKVFKSAVLFKKFPDRRIPVSSASRFVSVCGTDTANYMITGNSAGRVTAMFSSGKTPADERNCVEWKTEGSPSIVRLLSPQVPSLLLSYSDADELSLYEVLPRGSGLNRLNAETAFPPFAVGGEAGNDSASIVAVYRSSPDSSVGASYFTSIKRNSEFIEHDYSIADSEEYLSSAVVVSPRLAFLRITRLSPDSLRVSSTALKSASTSTAVIRAHNARFLPTAANQLPLLAAQEPDTLDLYTVADASPGVSVTRLFSTPFDSADFSSIRVTVSGSARYMSYYDDSAKSVFLYSIGDSIMHFVKAWHVEHMPADISVSIPMKTIYFLNAAQSYVSVHSF